MYGICAPTFPLEAMRPATIISGVDASTGVVSRDNPVARLVRINGPAITASAGRGTGRKINITGCTVLGSAIGGSIQRARVRSPHNADLHRLKMIR